MRSNKHNIKVGDVFPTNYSGDVVVTYVNSSTDVGVRFDSGFSRSVSVGNLVKGKVSDTTSPKVSSWNTGRKLTNDAVLKSFVEKHGDLYDYSRVDYKDSASPVLIGCRIHGFVEVTTYQHLNTGGCHECGKLKKKTPTSFEEFVSRAKATHGEKYSYHKESFSLMHNRTKITCKTHGDFTQQAASHVVGRGCQKCALIVMGNTHKDSSEDFLKKAVAKHGDTYDLSLVEYKHHDVDITIGCTAHGQFQMRPDRFLKGQACPVCSRLEQSMSLRHDKEKFIAKAEAIHGKSYDYTAVEYITSKKDVLIGCTTCNSVFSQTPHNHVAGKHGCPVCNACGFIRAKPAYLYVLQHKDVTKVGITNRAVRARVKQINKSSGKDFEEVYSVYSDSGKVCSDAERLLLRELSKEYMPVAEKYDGSTECFYNVDLSKLINRIGEVVT